LVGRYLILGIAKAHELAGSNLLARDNYRYAIASYLRTAELYDEKMGIDRRLNRSINMLDVFVGATLVYGVATLPSTPRNEEQIRILAKEVIEAYERRRSRSDAGVSRGSDDRG